MKGRSIRRPAEKQKDRDQVAPVVEPPHAAIPAPPPRAGSSWRSWAGRLLLRRLTIPEASVVLIGAFFLSAVLGAIRQILFNARFGAGPEASAYFAADRLPDTLTSLIAGGALSAAMVPVFVSTVREEGEEAGWRLTNLVLAALVAALALIVLLGQLLIPTVVDRLLVPGFDPQTKWLTTTLGRIVLFQPLIIVAGTVCSAVLTSRNQFGLSALAIVTPNTLMITSILLSWAFPWIGVYAPAVGTLAGASVAVLIQMPGLVRQGYRLRPSWNPRDRHLREVIRLLIPNGLSIGVNFAGFVVDTSFASTVRVWAALPAIQNGWMLAGLPVTLLGGGIGLSAFSRLAAHASAHEWRAMRRTLLRTLAAACALSLPAMLVLVLLGRHVVRILFEHGRFDAAAGDLTFAVVVPYALAIPVFVATDVMSRGLIALRDTRTPLLANIVQLVLRVAIIRLLLGSLGVRAIPIALALSACLEALILACVLLLKLQRRIAASAPVD